MRKLSVELVGSFIELDPRYRKPAAVCPVTVRLPVTAVALVGPGPFHL